jgi:hypothetical protein
LPLRSYSDICLERQYHHPKAPKRHHTDPQLSSDLLHKDKQPRLNLGVATNQLTLWRAENILPSIKSISNPLQSSLGPHSQSRDPMEERWLSTKTASRAVCSRNLFQPPILHSTFQRESSQKSLYSPQHPDSSYLAACEQHREDLYPAQPPQIRSPIASSAPTTRNEHTFADGVLERTDFEPQPRASTQSFQIIAENSTSSTPLPTSEAARKIATGESLGVSRQTTSLKQGEMEG